MKTNAKIIVTCLLILAIIGGTYLYSTGGQGLLKLKKYGHEAKNTSSGGMTVSLSTDSPKGNRTVSVADDVFMFDLCGTLSSTKDVQKINFRFESDANLTPVTSGVFIVEFEDYGVYDNIPPKSFSFENLTPNILEGSINLSSGSLSLSRGTCKKIVLRLPTAAMISERAAMDDHFAVTLESLEAWSTAGSVGRGSALIRHTAEGVPLRGNNLSY